MAVDARGGCVGSEEDGIASTPAETCRANFEIVGGEGGRGSAERFEEAEDSRLAD